jgi:dihydrofolate reductase
MGRVMAGMTMSLDGFMDADKVSPDFEELLTTPSFKEMIEDTGAVIMGNNTYHMADPFDWINDDYEFQVPLFILTHTPPEKFPPGNDKLSVTFVGSIEEAIEKAKAAAGDKMVQIIGGAQTIQQALNSGMCDELGIDLMPLILGKGLKLFENIDTDKIKLERISVKETTAMRTSIMFKVTKL